MLIQHCHVILGFKIYCKYSQILINDIYMIYLSGDKVNAHPSYKLPNEEQPVLNSSVVPLSNLPNLKQTEVGNISASISKQSRAEEIAELFRTAAKNRTNRIAKVDLERVFKIQFVDPIVQTENYVFRKVPFNSRLYTIE